MALTPEQFLQKVLNEKGCRANECFLTDSLAPWIEEYGEDGFDKFVSSIEEDIEVIRDLQQRFLRERGES